VSCWTACSTRNCRATPKRRLTLSNDEAYDLAMEVATGRLDDVEPIADRLRTSTSTWT